jgi:sec-independent protein translocase protein TatA
LGSYYRAENLAMFRNPVTDAIIALVVVLLVFGPKRLPALARSLGESIHEFKDSITERSSSGDQPALTAAQPAAAPSPSEPARTQASSER